MLSKEMSNFIERHSGSSLADVISLSPNAGQKRLIRAHGCGSRIDEHESRAVVDRGSILQGMRRFGYSDEYDAYLTNLS